MSATGTMSAFADDGELALVCCTTIGPVPWQPMAQIRQMANTSVQQARSTLRCEQMPAVGLCLSRVMIRVLGRIVILPSPAREQARMEPAAPAYPPAARPEP